MQLLHYDVFDSDSDHCCLQFQPWYAHLLLDATLVLPTKKDKPIFSSSADAQKFPTTHRPSGNASAKTCRSVCFGTKLKEFLGISIVLGFPIVRVLFSMTKILLQYL